MEDSVKQSGIESLAGAQESPVERPFTARHWELLAYSLILGAVVLIFATFFEYGISYDEDWHAKYGEYIVQWYASGFQDDRALTYWTLPLQGGFFSTISSLATRLSPMGDFETSHLINALFGLLGVLGAYKLGKYLAGPFAGFLAALFLLLTPRFYGHAFNNRVDIPMATLTIFAIFYMLQLVDSLPYVSKRIILKLGVVIGLALAVRAGSVILIGYLGIALCIWLVSHNWSQLKLSWRGLDLRSQLFKVAGAFAAVCVIAYLMMLVWWPAAQVRPIVQPAKGLLYATDFGYTIDVLFDGETIPNTELPWYYLPKWFLITLPEFYFIALIVGLSIGTVALAKSRWSVKALLKKQHLGLLLILIFVALPLIFTVLTRPTDYDGIRHFLFVLPPLAVMAAVSIDWLVRRTNFPASLPAILVLVAIAASLVITAIDMIQLHPHQYVYFNRVFGNGLPGATGLYDTDYWGNSYKEGVEWLASNYNSDGTEGRPKVASCAYSLSTSYFLPEDQFEYVGSYHDGQHIADNVVPDLLLATTRWNCHKKVPGSVLHAVTRQGAPLLYVIDVASEDASPD